MYTEENEFDYNDYLDEEEKNNNNSNKPFIDFGFILKVIIIAILIILIIFLVFKIKNRNVSGNKEKNEVLDSAVVLNDNMNLIKNAAYAYFFNMANLPEEVGKSKFVNVNDLIDNELIISVNDSKGNMCGYNTSGATVTKNINDYEMVVKLNCGDSSDEKTYYYNFDGNCLNCNGENYTSNKEENNNQNNSQDNNIQDNNNNQNNSQENNIQDNNNNQNNDYENNNNQNDSNNNTTRICTEFSDWTSVYKADSDLEIETRTVVKGYKEDISYGEWSEPTTEKIDGTDNLEVKVSEQVEQTTDKKCSSESTKKPSSKEGREISSRTETHSTTKTVCVGGGTVTKTLTKWDNSAKSCRSYGIGKVVCTYETKCTNKQVTTTKNVTYYTYCDTITKDITKTYYQARTINKNTVYTDYILESEMPEGYKKLDGSEIVQYRYREKCVK